MVKLYFFLFKNNNIRLAFLLPFILSKMDGQIPSDAQPTIQFAFNIFILAVIGLFSFIYAIGYLISLNLISRYDINNKFPKYVWLIKYFEQSSMFIVIFELVIGFTCSIIIILSSLTMCGVSHPNATQTK